MKSQMKKFSWIVILALVGLLSITAITTASDIVWPWSSDPGFEPQSFSDTGSVGNRVDEGGTGLGEPVSLADAGEASTNGEVAAGQAQTVVHELQPDDDGYTGSITEAPQIESVLSGDGQTEQIDWDALIPESAPDQVNINDAGPNWSDFYYYHVTGTALRPRDSSSEWASSGDGGCLYQTAGSAFNIFNVHLDIPHGARIDYLRIFYYDTSAKDTIGWVTRYDDEGGISDVTHVGSTGTPGYGTNLSPLVSHVVESDKYSYVLNWRSYELGSAIRLCGLRVAYRLP